MAIRNIKKSQTYILHLATGEINYEVSMLDKALICKLHFCAYYWSFQRADLHLTWAAL